ncbi:orotate phosphoribosyltransferase [Streptomyces sp. Agncl-13]|uniref:orotate phosphoribosyltransferase n=1 Tax=Streptomyces sp. Agncl-13 TaxID=3400628 RepID=UPI003A83D64A
MNLPLHDLLVGPGYAHFQNDGDRRRELARDIVAAAHLRGDYVLRSGARSTYYLDTNLFETKPTVLRRLAELLARRVPTGVARLAGAGADAAALTAVMAIETGLPFVVVRGTHGSRPLSAAVKGELHPGETVLCVADVVATGREVLTAVAALRAAGAHVVGVLAVVDRRSEGAAAAIAAADLPFDALFTVDELLSGGTQ